MPMYEMYCPVCGWTRDIFVHKAAQRDERIEYCEPCGMVNVEQRLCPGFSAGKGLTYFAEGGKGKWINNLGPQPVFITSARQHERIMKEQGVTWAPAKRGMPGSWF